MNPVMLGLSTVNCSHWSANWATVMSLQKPFTTAKFHNFPYSQIPISPMFTSRILYKIIFMHGSRFNNIL